MMKSFKKNEINTDFDLISRELKRFRIEKKLSLEEASRRTKINIKYLIALENGDFLSLPKGLYAKNFLKQYAFFLGLSLSSVLEVYEGAENIKEGQNKNLFSNQVVKNKYFFAIPSLFKNLLIFFSVSILFGYLFFSISKLNSAPKLNVIYPPDNYVSMEKTISIRGVVDEGTDIAINGDGILVNKDGSFSQALNLKEGINQIVIEAKRKDGKINIIKKQILFKN